MVRMAICAVVLFVCSGPVHAIRLNEQGCVSLAAWSADTIWAKHVGADKEKVRTYYAERQEPYFKLILKDFDKIWELPLSVRTLLAEEVYKSCVMRGGIYEELGA